MNEYGVCSSFVPILLKYYYLSFYPYFDILGKEVDISFSFLWDWLAIWIVADNSLDTSWNVSIHDLMNNVFCVERIFINFMDQLQIPEIYSCKIFFLVWNQLSLKFWLVLIQVSILSQVICSIFDIFEGMNFRFAFSPAPLIAHIMSLDIIMKLLIIWHSAQLHLDTFTRSWC